MNLFIQVEMSEVTESFKIGIWARQVLYVTFAAMVECPTYFVRMWGIPPYSKQN